jgi:Ca2+-binding EF-hand superfamily protein
MREAFDSMDINKDGNLSKQEVKAAICFNPVVREILEIPDTASEDFDELYGKIDLDNSLSVTYDEFHTYFAKQKDDIAKEKRRLAKEEHFQNHLKSAYKMVDINGDGDVSKQEMLMAIQSNYKIQEMLGNKGGMSKEEFEECYAKIDEDGSDFIDFEEFKRFFVKKRIEEMDKAEKEELCHKKAFNLMDVDGSNSLTKAELLLGLKDNPRIQSLMGVPETGVDSDEFKKMYAAIDKDGSNEIDFDEFKEFFIKMERKARLTQGRSRGKSMGKKDMKEMLDSESERSDGASTPKAYGTKKRAKKQVTKTRTASEDSVDGAESPTAKKTGTRHAYFGKGGAKKKKKAAGGADDEWDDGAPRDMFGWQGERKDLVVEDKRVMTVRRDVKFTGLNCDFAGWRYVMTRCVECKVGFARMKLMPDDLALCDRCVLERHWKTKEFCRLVPLYAEKVRAAPRPRPSEANEMFEEPDEIQLMGFYIGQRRYFDAERTMQVLLERQSENLKNGGADHVAMGFTLRAMAGYEEARGRLPFARALRENSLDVFAGALGPTHKQVMMALELYTDTLQKQGYWYEAIEFYNSVYMQFRDSKLADRVALADEMLVKVANCLEGREKALMEVEDALSKANRESIKPKLSHHASLNFLLDDEDEMEERFENRDKIPIKYMKKMLMTDDYWNMVGTKDFRHMCKLVGCFNLFKFWMGVTEFKNMRSGEAGFSHTCRRIYREFIQQKDMLEFVDSETREQLGEILETEKRAPPADMYDEIWSVATNVLYDDAFLKFTTSEQGKRWWKDFNLMEESGDVVVKVQSYLRVISCKRLIKLCSWLELTLREYNKHKHDDDDKTFRMWFADRKRLKGLADSLGCSLTEYLQKFGELRPDQFVKWKEGKTIRMNEAKALRTSMGISNKKKEAKVVKKIVKGTFEVQFIVHKCRGLMKADTFGKSDPVVIVSYKGEEVGRTSVMNKNLNPDWGKWKINSVMVEGKLGEGGVPEVFGGVGGMFTFEVYDMDMGIKLGDFLGETTISAMMATDDTNRIIKEEHELKAKKGAKFSATVGGSVVVSCKSQWVKSRAKEAPLTFKATALNGEDCEPGEGPKGNPIANATGMIGGMMDGLNIGVPEVFKNKKVMVEPHFKMMYTLHRCKNLAKADLFGKSDPCVVVMYKGKEMGRSSIVNKNLNPEWGTVTERGYTGGFEFEPPMKVFSDADGKVSEDEKDELVTFEVYDADMKMLGDFLGCVEFRVGRLLGMKGTKDAEFQLQQKKNAKKKSKLVQGTVHLSFDTDWDKGGEVEVEGLASKAGGLLNKAALMTGAKEEAEDPSATDYSVIDFSNTGNNTGKKKAGWGN